MYLITQVLYELPSFGQWPEGRSIKTGGNSLSLCKALCGVGINNFPVLNHPATEDIMEGESPCAGYENVHCWCVSPRPGDGRGDGSD